MGQQTRAKVDRRRREIASSYRKQGYRVTTPAATETMPALLRDCHPDLIAERDDDKVVIEIKPSTGLKGSNDLVELASRVAEQHGWQLELVTVHVEPDYTSVLEPGWLEEMLRQGEPASNLKTECFYRTEVLAQLIRGLASARNLGTRDKTTLHLARELAYEGVLDQQLLDRIENAVAWIDSVLAQMPGGTSPYAQFHELERLCGDILSQAQPPED